MHHVFLSYSRDDSKMMQRVRDDLRSVGLVVWTDEGIEPGTVSWKESIEHAINHTHMLVVLLSKAANDSKWVQREIDYADVRNKPIIPVLIAGHERDAIPFALAGAQLVDLRQGYAKHIRQLQKRCVEQLELNDATTLVHRAEVTLPIPVRRRKKARKWTFALTVTLLLSLLGIWFFLNKDTLLETRVIADSDAHILLQYNRDTLVFLNDTGMVLELESLRFSLSHDTGETVTFTADAWSRQAIRVGRCLQVWRAEYPYLSPDAAPADSCYSRVGYQSTSNLFWVSDNDTLLFEVWRGEALLGTCPTVHNDSSEILRCVVGISDE